MSYSIDDIGEMFREGMLIDDCTMIIRDYGKCHNYPCDDCINRVQKETEEGREL